MVDSDRGTSFLSNGNQEQSFNLRKIVAHVDSAEFLHYSEGTSMFHSDRATYGIYKSLLIP